MLLRRKAMKQLENWRKSSRGSTAILLEGARRVGKSTLVKTFGKEQYESYILVDFSELPTQVRSIFEDESDELDTFFMMLSTYYRTKLYNRSSLIIFDEVQRYPKAREMVKRLVADGRYDYIETGSLVSIKQNVRDILIPSEEHAVALEPLDFEEFCWARGEELLAEAIVHAFEAGKGLPDPLHKRAMRLWREYLLVGGMPQAVVLYLETRDFGVVDAAKRDILSLYRNDIGKFGGSEAARVRAVFNTIPGQLAKHEKKFTLAAIDANARSREYDSAFAWLEDARMVNLCRNCTDPSVGLELSEESNSIKCYMADTGLLVAQSFADRAETPDDVYRSILFDRLSLNEGMLVENAVAQQLKSAGHRLFFHSQYKKGDSDHTLEIDFLVVRAYEDAAMRPRVSPIEVKSGRSYGTSSLNKFKGIFGKRVGIEYVLHPRQLTVVEGRVYLPLYMAFCL